MSRRAANPRLLGVGARKGLTGMPPVVVPAVWASMIGDYLDTLRAAGRSERTVELRSIQLTGLARELGGRPQDVTGDDLIRWLAGHADWKIETRRSNRAAARLFFQWAYRVGRIPTHIADDLPMVKPSYGQPRPLPDDAWNAALAVADSRTTLILRLAGEAGLRRAEIARVRIGDLMEGPAGAQLLVHGKGNKQRVVPLNDTLAALIRAGAPKSSATTGRPRAHGSGDYLFPNYTGGHLDPKFVAQLAQSALPPPWTLHSARHRFATRAYRGTRNLRAVQRLLGHASIATTERYTAVDDDEMRAAALAAVL